MFKKSLLLFLALCLLLSIPLTSCGNNSGEKETQEGTDTTMQETETTKETETSPTDNKAPYNYQYPKDEYEKDLDLFGSWSDNFVPGERTLAKMNQSSYDNGKGCYVVTRPEYVVDGVRTFASIDRDYSPAMHINVDAYVVSSDFKKNYQRAGYDTVGSSGSFSKSNYSLTHPEVLQCDENGKTDGFWEDVVLTKEVLNLNYNQWIKKSITKDLWQLQLAEPENFRAGSFSQAFKNLWKLKYGFDFESPYDNVSAMFYSQRLALWTQTNAIKFYVSNILTKNPDFNRFSIAPHSTLAYATIGDGVTDGFAHMMGTGLVRSVTGQTWSNTMEGAIRYAGKNVQDPFINGLIDYGTYIDATDYYGADLYALCDPMSDTAASVGTEDYWRSLCHMQLVASLMYPEINRWELIWTNRSFMNVSADYRTEQLNIHNALLDISGKEYRYEGGTTDIVYLLSDTLTWQSDKCSNWGGSAYDGFWGVVSPLAYDGILPRTRAMELITSKKDLEGVKLLIVSYDNQKPLYSEVNTAIAEWVKDGGTLLFLGGPDQYLDVEGAWWLDAKGASPVGHLLQQLGLDVDLKALAGKQSSVIWTGSQNAPADLKGLNVSGNGFTYAFDGEGIQSLLETENHDTIGFTADVGKGHVLFSGVATSNMSDSVGGANLMRALTEQALTYTDYDYVTSDVYMVERGDYVALYPLNDSYTLDGTYVNIFSSNLEVVTNPVIAQGTAALFKRVSNVEIPTVAFAGGVWECPTATQDKTVIQVKAADNACASIRVAVPEGLYPLKIDAQDENGHVIIPAVIWDDESSSLLIQIFATPKTYDEITILWGTEKSQIANTHYQSSTIVVNNSGADKQYIVKNTGSANGAYRYTDRATEIIWKFDTSDKAGLVIAVGLCNNYYLEASADGENWEKVINILDISNVPSEGTNQAVATIYASNYAANDGTLFIRIRNSNPNGSWGGAVRFFDFQSLEKTT